LVSTLNVEELAYSTLSDIVSKVKFPFVTFNKAPNSVFRIELLLRLCGAGGFKELVSALDRTRPSDNVKSYRAYLDWADANY
jgi:hypothetical protein